MLQASVFGSSSEQKPFPLPFSPRQRLWLAVLGVVYALYTIAQWSLGYIDFGDGNYMYIAGRIADGVVVYRDLLAPQPPMHLFTGALLIKLSRLCGAETPVYFFRAFSLLLHLVTYWQIVWLARRAWGSGATALAAGAIYLFLPIGFWWALGYQSEPLEIAFLLAMMQCALYETRRGDLSAGLFAALSGLTNATAAPFLFVLILYMLITQPRRALRMAWPCIALVAVVTGALELWTGGAYLQNVVFNQVGTYPKGRFLSYAWGKLTGQGSKVLYREGVFILLALLGLVRFLRVSPLAPQSRGGLGWFCLATLGAIVYVTKGGTADYIFSLSEPAVALLAAGELAALGCRLRAIEHHRLLAVLALLPLAIVALLPGIDLHASLFTQRMYELDTANTAIVRAALERESKPDQPVLGPPFYAVLAGRRLLGEYSEIFIWTISYANDVNARNPQGQGWRKVQELSTALARREAPIVIIEMDQTGTIPEIMQALRAGYQPIQLDRHNWVFPTMNTRLGAFVPTRNSPAEVNAAWTAFETSLRAMYGEGARKFAGWLPQ